MTLKREREIKHWIFTFSKIWNRSSNPPIQKSALHVAPAEIDWKWKRPRKKKKEKTKKSTRWQVKIEHTLDPSKQKQANITAHFSYLAHNTGISHLTKPEQLATLKPIHLFYFSNSRTFAPTPPSGHNVTYTFSRLIGGKVPKRNHGNANRAVVTFLAEDCRTLLQVGALLVLCSTYKTNLKQHDQAGDWWLPTPILVTR